MPTRGLRQCLAQGRVCRRLWNLDYSGGGSSRELPEELKGESPGTRPCARVRANLIGGGVAAAPRNTSGPLMSGPRTYFPFFPFLFVQPFIFLSARARARGLGGFGWPE